MAALKAGVVEDSDGEVALARRTRLLVGPLPFACTVATQAPPCLQCGDVVLALYGSNDVIIWRMFVAIAIDKIDGMALGVAYQELGILRINREHTLVHGGAIGSRGPGG